MTNSVKRFLTLSVCTLTLSMLSACGGGAGDEPLPDNNAAAARAVEPLIGVWDLPRDWNGIPNDTAHLVINAPDAEGVAVATIFDLDDTSPGSESNCFEVDGFPGTVFQSVTDELFLEVSAFPAAIAELTPAGDLQISVFSEAAGTGVPPERVLTATRLGITELDIPLCDS